MPEKLNIPIRPRRNRKTPAIRGLVRETTLSPSDLIYPLFIHEDVLDVPIESMPGCHRWSLNGLIEEVGRAYAVGVRAIVFFPKIEETLKTPHGEECFNPDGLVPRAIRRVKEAYPDVAVITDVALDPYNSDGHDGIVEKDENGELKILNDETVAILCQQALCHADAGADVVSPSDMMDGRIGAIREALDAAGHEEISILSYAVKYASAYYGPFRGALDSAPKAGDKKTYQMDPANSSEALREVDLDIAEGADMVMVKPAGPYLDVISLVRDSVDVPVAAYQVSGEYLMIKSAAKDGWIDEEKVAMESLLGIKRAGASMILTYFAKDVAERLG
ncbi:MAG: porphobilinogen synthase [Verrucomicrobiales bacterium]|nr:porphobilinogen synthase [Verrucomicrobiales bacterium]